MPGKSAAGWTSLAALRSLSVTAWNRGQVMLAALEPSGVYPRRRVLKRPSAAELRDDYAAAREWAAGLFAAAGPYSLETVDVGRTTIGSNQLPAVAVFASAADEAAFVGKSRELARFLSLVGSLAALDPSLREWAARRPKPLLDLGEAALTAARVALWLREHPSPGVFVRQLSIPGVHTKFIETHRKTIDEMVAVLVGSQAAGPMNDLAEVPIPSDAGEGLLGAMLPGHRPHVSPRVTDSFTHRSRCVSEYWTRQFPCSVMPEI